MQTRTLLPAFVSLVALSAGAQAQWRQPRPPSSSWAAFGLGYGSFDCPGWSLECRRFDGRVSRATSAYAAVGKVLGPHRAVGFEVATWMKLDLVTTGSYVMIVRPWSRAGLRLKGSAGVAMIREYYGDDIITSTKFGLAASLGAGYEARLSPVWTLMPAFNLVRTFHDHSRNMWQFVLGLNWQKPLAATRRLSTK